MDIHDILAILYKVVCKLRFVDNLTIEQYHMFMSDEWMTLFIWMEVNMA